MNRIRLALAALVVALAAAACVPSTTPHTPPPPTDVHVQVCPPYCGGQPTWCIGYGTDDDLHIVQCAP